MAARSRLAFLALIAFATSSLGQPPPNVLPRVVVVISDLHLGRGEVKIGEYLPQEDFQWGEDFVTFLDALHRAGGGKVTLIVAGDMFELWESADQDCLAEADFGCSDEEATRRITAIVGAHRVELQALGAFASRGANQVVIIPGNHDAALVYPNVWRIVLAAARPLREDHFTLAKEGRWISPSANIVVEHGHQIDDANKFEDWPKPIGLAPSGIERLRKPFGEVLVRQFFDVLEQKYPVVDNITDGAGILYGVKREGVVGTARVFSDFLKFVALDTSRRQFGNFLGSDANPPVWDVEETRKMPRFFFENGFPLEDTSTLLVREVLAQAKPEVEAALGETLAAMSEEEVLAVCQSRYSDYLRAAEANVPDGQRPATCPQKGGDLGYLKQNGVKWIRGSTYYVDRYLGDVVGKLPLVAGKAIVFVYGHTHSATRATPSGDSKVINTGAWQRIVSADTVAATAKKAGWTADQVLAQLKLSALPACYSFVWIPFQYGKPADPKLRYWAYDSSGDLWKFTNDCPEREALPPE